MASLYPVAQIAAKVCNVAYVTISKIVFIGQAFHVGHTLKTCAVVVTGPKIKELHCQDRCLICESPDAVATLS
jgi:hypothetical protein